MAWYWFALAFSLGLLIGLPIGIYLLDRMIMRQIGLGGWE